MRPQLRRIFEESVRVKRQFLRDHSAALEKAVDLIVDAFADGHKLLLFGNGGSAADAQHIAAEFVNRYQMERPPLPAIALTTDSSALTSIANDYGYGDVFAKQVLALGHTGDVAIAISTSGNAANVLRAVKACKQRGIPVIAFTGGSGGKLAAAANVVLCVDATKETARIQETHIVIGHAICQLVDDELFGGEAP